MVEVSSDVCQGLTLGPVLFTIFVNDLDEEAESTFSRFTDNTKLGRLADVPDGHATIQRDLYKLQNKAERNRRISSTSTRLKAKSYIWVGITEWKRGNGHELKIMKFHLNTRQHFSTVEVVKQWNRLSKELVESPSLQIFKAQQDTVLGNVL